MIWRNRRSLHRRHNIDFCWTCCPKVANSNLWFLSMAHDKWAVAVHTDFSEQQFLHSFPKGTKVVHRQFYKGVFRVDDVNGKDSDVKCHDSCKLEHSAYEIFTIGIPREPVDFLEKAVHAGHPRSIAIHLPQAVKDVLDENFSGDEYKLAKERASFSKRTS